MNPLVAQLNDIMATRDTSEYRLAKDIPMAKQTINHILSGQVDPRLSNVQAIAHQLGYNLQLVPKSPVKVTRKKKVSRTKVRRP